MQDRGEGYVVAIALDFHIRQGDGTRNVSECRYGVSAHDLRRDKELETIDEVLGKECGVEAGSGFGEEGENAFGAEMVEDAVKRNTVSS